MPVYKILIYKMRDFDLDIQAVLEKELYTKPPLMPVIVARITGSKRDIPKAFRATKDLSTTDLKHLRRVRNLPGGEIECILCKTKSNRDNPVNELEELKEMFSEEGIFESYRVAYVPSSAPKTDHQLRTCNEIWPCKFAKCNYLIQCMDGSLFNEAEKLVLKIIVKNLLTYIESNSATITAGAIIFRCAKIHGIGLSSQQSLVKNPLMHPTMVSIDSVAVNEGSGHWKSSTDDTLMQLMQSELDKQEELKDHRIDARFLPYLCTNYDIFVTEEPCFLCTMGLIQSRIRRLFYLDAESVEKLTSCRSLCYPDRAIEDFLIHREQSLNHRFEAWRIRLLPHETQLT